MSIAYDRALLAKQCADLIATAERVHDALPFYDFINRHMLSKLISCALNILEERKDV